MALSIPPERPVPGPVVAILRHASAVAEAEAVDCVVGGAVARDLLLFHVFGEPTTRATRDVDLMVGVEHWAAFEAFRTRLVATGAFVGVPGLPHRLLYGGAGIPLDLVPFGGIEDPAGTVAWPPERRVLMSVVGFREATAAAVAVEVAHELTVPSGCPANVSEAHIARAFAENFAARDWPAGRRLPELFYDPRALSPEPGPKACLHAKCIVVDDARAFVTSANFTEAAQERNIEGGVLVNDPAFARALRAQFESLVTAGQLERCAPRPSSHPGA